MVNGCIAVNMFVEILVRLNNIYKLRW